MGADLTPDQALAEIGRVARRVRETTRGPARVFLVLGVATVIYWTVMFLGSGPMTIVAGICWLALTIAGCAYWYRLRVYERRLARINSRVSVVYSATTLITFIVGSSVAPEEPTGWWAAVAVLLALITAAPPAFAGWTLLSRR